METIVRTVAAVPVKDLTYDALFQTRGQHGGHAEENSGGTWQGAAGLWTSLRGLQQHGLRPTASGGATLSDGGLYVTQQWRAGVCYLFLLPPLFRLCVPLSLSFFLSISFCLFLFLSLYLCLFLSFPIPPFLSLLISLFSPPPFFLFLYPSLSPMSVSLCPPSLSLIKICARTHSCVCLCYETTGKVTFLRMCDVICCTCMIAS